MTTRGTTNRNVRGSAETRRRRREWLVLTYRADYDVGRFVQTDDETGAPVYYETVARGSGMAACRCYRCGVLLTVNTVTVDRIIPGCQGGTYRRNNIRPACGSCNSETGGSLRSTKPKRKSAAV